MLTRVYQLLWLLLHIFASVYEILRWLSLRLQAATLWSYDICCRRRSTLSASLISRHERVFLEHCKQQLDKLPQHLNVIVGPENSQMNEELISRLITYALIMDIDCVSVYDTRLVGSGKNVRIEKLRTPKGVNCKQLDERRFLWSMRNDDIDADAAKVIVNGKRKVIENNGCTNGAAAKNGITRIGLQHFAAAAGKKANKSVEIYQIAPHDGRPLIADVCRDLFEQRHQPNIQKLLQDRDSLTEHINTELLHRLHKLSDPELSIIFASNTCTFGTLPWQTRFTEFYTFNPAHYLNAVSFAKVLYRYSRCEQRWGK